MTHKKLLASLAVAMPSVALQTIWEHDEDTRWSEIKECMGPRANPEDWQAWQSEVRVTAVLQGKLVTGSAYLCGTWERSQDHPSKSNPDISGYLPQMLVEAVSELQKQADKTILAEQLNFGREMLDREMRARYAAQMKKVV